MTPAHWMCAFVYVCMYACACVCLLLNALQSQHDFTVVVFRTFEMGRFDDDDNMLLRQCLEPVVVIVNRPSVYSLCIYSESVYVIYMCAFVSVYTVCMHARVYVCMYVHTLSCYFTVVLTQLHISVTFALGADRRLH